MTTPVANIIYDGLREGNIIPVGATAGSYTAEQTEALGKLNAFIFTTIGFDAGEELSDWLVPAPQRTAPVAANFPQLPYPQNTDPLLVGFPVVGDTDVQVWQYPPKNSRIVFGGVTATAYFPEAPDDGSRMAVIQGSGAGDDGMTGTTLTLDGNGRTIEGNPTLVLTDPITPQMFFYRSDLGDWKQVAGLAITDNMPFPMSCDDYFAMALAIRLAPRYGKTISPETTAAFKRADTAFKAKFRQHGTAIYGSTDFPNSLQSFISGRFWF